MRETEHAGVPVSRGALASIVVLGGVAAFVVFQSFRIEAATCEVCMSYKGRSQCRTVSAANEEEATMGAITNACAFLSSGVTDSMACGRAEPVSVSCR